MLEFTHSFIAFGQEFSFVSATALAEAQMLSRDCDTAEEVFYRATTCLP